MDTAGYGFEPTRLELERSSDSYGRTSLAVAGEVDISTADHLRRAVTEILTEPSVAGLVLDFAPLDFIDSSGVAVLVRAKELAHSRHVDFSVVNAHGKVLRVLSVLGVIDALKPIDQRQAQPGIIGRRETL